MRTIEETCQFCYWSAMKGPVKDGKFYSTGTLEQPENRFPLRKTTTARSGAAIGRFKNGGK